MSYRSYKTSSRSSAYSSYPPTQSYPPYISGNIPKIAKKIVKNVIGEISICCIDSRDRYQFPVLFYISNKDGADNNGYYLFGITLDGNLKLLPDITIHLNVDTDEYRRLKIIGVDEI